MKKCPIAMTQLLKGLGLAGFLAFFFYRSVWAFFPMLLPAGLFLWWEQKKEFHKRNKRLLQQFSECILSVGSSVKAGYAAENAFLESMKDMEMMFGPDAEILEELSYIKGGLVNHVSLEKLLQDMGNRTGLEQVQETAEILAITKRNGGSLVDVVNMMAQTISSRLTLEEELYTALASKRLEQRILNCMPFLLVLYLESTTPGYFDMFYGDIWGVAIMTGFLVWYGLAYALSEYILWKLHG